MVAGPTRKISERSTVRSPNAMFASLSTELHSVLVEGSLPPASDLSLYYVTHRLSTHTFDERSELIGRMPNDIAALAKSTSDRPALIDSLELDLIDFLLFYKNNRAISIVGTVGVGKSTFLKYVLRQIRPSCPSLHRFVPIIVNCLYIGSKNPLFQDLIYEISRAVQEIHADTTQPFKVNKYHLNMLIKEYSLTKGDLFSSAHFIEFVKQLSKACERACEPVIIFDNLDHLDVKAIQEVVELARAVHLTTGLAVITAMRPATHTIQSDISTGGGAFYGFLLEVKPPDIRAVIARRLKIAFRYSSNKRARLSGSALLHVDSERSINSLCEKILNPKTQEIYIRDICNNNVRMALASLDNFLRYRELKYALLFDLKVEEPEILHGTWFDHLIDGLMIGDLDYFIDGGGAICNILYFLQNEGVDYTLIYIVLCIVGWAGKPFIKLRALGDWLEKFGYRWHVAKVAIEHVLRRGLLYSPETERDIKQARNLRLSHSGIYYQKFLIENPQYLFNAIYDVPLPHSRWQESDGDSFVSRINSIWELIEIVYAEERLKSENMIGREDLVPALGAIDYGGYLAGRLCKAALKLTGDATHARSEATRIAAKEFEMRFCAIARDIVDGESKLRARLSLSKLIPEGEIVREILEGSLGGANLVRLSVPSELAPAKNNSVTVEIDMEGIEQSLPIVALWQASDGDKHYGEIVELSRTFDRSIYHGSFSISGVRSISRFPRSALTVFCSSDPIGITMLEGSSYHRN